MQQKESSLDRDIEIYQEREQNIIIEGVVVEESAPYGALVVYVNKDFQGKTVEAKGLPTHYAANIVERRINGELTYAAFFPRVKPDTYWLRCETYSLRYHTEYILTATATVFAGHVAEVDWRNEKA